ncbi:MAG TPA: IS21 family transposase [Phycisphaerales bacterium]|nr:IS21 family transposase [Phycisphaerales bacterium]
MANQLKMAVVHAILTLAQLGWSQRRIAGVLGVDRETVARYVHSPPADSKPATNPIPGSAAAEAPLADKSSGPESLCEPFRAVIETKLGQGLTGQRIYQDLVEGHGFTASYSSVRRFLQRLGQSQPLPFRRLEVLPGEQAQVDFGVGAPILRPDDKRRCPHVFRVVLSFSRKAYSEVVYHQTTENFLRCLENAFWHFGGVTQTTVIDNLKAAVSRADWYDPDLHPKIQSFCQHYGTVILPTKPRMPRHKGKVERGIDYVQSNALKGRTFASLAEQNQHLLDWERRIADTRIHGTTRKQVRVLFEEEKPYLTPLPTGRFPSFEEGRRSVHRDGHIEVAKAYYSVPPEYTGRQVWVRWDSHLVRIFNSKMESIAVHVQVEPGTFQTQDRHLHDKKISQVEKGTVWLLRRSTLIGTHVEQWARQMLETRGISGVRILVGLLSLTRSYTRDQIDQACSVALTHGAIRLKTLRQLLERGGPVQQQFAFLDEHPIIRPMADYESVVQNALGTEADQERSLSQKGVPR